MEWWLLAIFIGIVLYMMIKGLKLVEDDTPEYQREPDTTIMFQGKQINIRKRTAKPNKVVIAPEDGAFK